MSRSDLNPGKRPRWNAWWQRSSHFAIGKPNDPMLIRHRLIQTPLFGLYVHRFYREDQDRAVHDHPWSFWSLRLRGSYVEELRPDARIDATVTHTPRRLHRMPLRSAHRITYVQPGTVTVILTGPRRRAWGFWDGSRWVDYRDAFDIRPKEGVS